MSGGDLRNFVTSHRVDIAEKMVRRAKEGVACTSIRPMNYDQLLAMIDEKKSAGDEALMKLKKIEVASRQRKDESRGKQHRLVWNHELIRLATIRRQLQLELDAMAVDFISGDSGSLLRQIYNDLTSFNDSLADDFAEFKKTTADSVWALRDDVQTWLHVCQSGASEVSVELEQPEAVLETIASVKQQQRDVMKKLEAEQQQLELELNIIGLIDPSTNGSNRYIQTGIPEDAFNLECPDLDLKASVLQQFILLDGKYVEKLNELEQNNYAILDSEFGGWSGADHDMFLYVTDAYAQDMNITRALCIDCLQHCLPHKTRMEIVKHEDWWTLYKFYHNHRRSLLVDWTRDRTELLNHIKNVFNEACILKQWRDIKDENRQKQQEFCDALYAKVSDWRDRKMEAFRLQQKLAEAARQEADQARLAQEEKEKQKREKQKAKINQFHETLNRRQTEREARDKRRLEELQQFFKEQAAYDQERVKFREEELLKKQDERERKREEQLAMEEEKERVLEAIRQKVRPHVECDLLRLWSDTIAWQARQKPEEHIYIQQPLFDIKSFTANQILADPRVRVEQRLREAGLQTSDYARHILSKMQPAHPPRRDMESTIFKYMDN